MPPESAEPAHPVAPAKQMRMLVTLFSLSVDFKPAMTWRVNELPKH